MTIIPAITAAPTRPATFNPDLSKDPKAPLAGAEVAEAAAEDARDATEDAPEVALVAREAALEAALATALHKKGRGRVSEVIGRMVGE